MDSTPDDTKLCRVCGQERPIEAFYRRSGRRGNQRSTCRPCCEESQRLAYLDEPPPEPSESIPFEKACPRCSRTLPLEAFASRREARYGRTSHCRDCRNDAKRLYDATHKDKRSGYQKRYYQENAEVCGKRIRASIAKKPEKYQQIHSDWKKQNVGACRAMAHRRHARARSAGSWTQFDWERLKAKYDWRCLGCGRQEITDGIKLCFDHVIPLSLGGWNIISNAQPLCRSCNSSKSRKVVDLRK